MAKLDIYAKPSSLYRYRKLGADAAQEFDALRGNYIYCPDYQSMNDPMEGMHRLSSRLAGKPSGPKSAEKVQSALDTMGIASMSEVFDHEPMWAHYADQFSGMCVQYSLNRLLRGLGDDISICRMMYSEREPVLLDDRGGAMDRARLSLSSKTVRWASEREWRLFRPTVGQARYAEPRTVTKIFLGARVSVEDQATALEVGTALRVPIVKMEIAAYSIAFKALPRARRLADGSR